MATVDIETRIQSASTQKELEKLLREVRELRKESRLGSDELHKNLKIEIDLKNRVGQLNKQAYSDSAKLKESYFNSGAALRQFYMEQRVGDRTIREAASTVKLFAGAFGVSGLTGGLEMATSAFQQTEFAVNSMGIAAQQAGGKIGQLGSSIISLGSAVVAPVAVAVAQILLIKDAIDKTEESAKRYRSAMIKAGLLNERVELAKEYGEIKPRYQGVEAGLIARLAYQYPWLASLLPSAYSDAEARKAQIRAQMQPGMNFGGGVHTWGTVLDEYTITGTNGGTSPYAYNPDWRYLQQYGVSPLTQSELGGRSVPIGMGRIGGTGLGNVAFRTPSTLGGVAGAPSAWGESSPAKVAYRELSASQQMFISSMQSGISSVSYAIRDGVGKAWEDVFGEANSLLEIFAKNLAMTFAGNFASWGIGKLFSFIPGVGPLIGSFFGYDEEKGGTGISNVSDTSNYSGPVSGVGGGVVIQQLNAIRRGIENMDLHVDDRGLAMSVNRGNQLNRRGMF